jgi:SPP1 gp7 family putative phage head morphogenesis protein
VADFPLLEKVLKLWQKRGLITSQAQLDELTDEMRGQVFSLAKEWREKALDAIKSDLDKALAEGWGVREFKEKAAETVARFNDGNYASIVYRTNVANARAAGRYEEMFSPEAVADVPYWQFSATIDYRNDEHKECPDLRCRWLDGKVFRKDDADALKYLPPLHFQCRCDSIQWAAGEYEGPVTKGSAVPFQPLDGWGGNRLLSLLGGL